MRVDNVHQWLMSRVCLQTGDKETLLYSVVEEHIFVIAKIIFPVIEKS
jgi:hypothetical protein